MGGFNIGDIVNFGSNHNYEVLSYDTYTGQYTLKDITTGIIYPGQGIGGAVLVQAAKTLTGTTAQPGQPKQYNNCKFKLGDIVVNTKGTTLEVTLVNIARQKYAFKILKHNTNPNKIGQMGEEDIHFADDYWEFAKDYIDKAKGMTKDIKPCTCDSRILFNKGCCCGAVVPYKARFK